jgi:hypothetical protein
VTSCGPAVSSWWVKAAQQSQLPNSSRPGPTEEDSYWYCRRTCLGPIHKVMVNMFAKLLNAAAKAEGPGWCHEDMQTDGSRRVMHQLYTAVGLSGIDTYTVHTLRFVPVSTGLLS